jgi:hypothetical protein
MIIYLVSLMKDKSVNIFSFTAEFGSEESCRTHFKEERNKRGVICKRCSHTEHYWIKSQWS